MNTITLKFKKAEKLKYFLELIKDLDYIEITSQETVKDNEEKEEQGDFMDIVGIWKDRDISLDGIRKKAWPDKK